MIQDGLNNDPSVLQIERRSMVALCPGSAARSENAPYRLHPYSF